MCTTNKYYDHPCIKDAMICELKTTDCSYSFIFDKCDYENIHNFLWYPSVNYKYNVTGIISGALVGVTLGMYLVNPVIKSGNSVIHIDGDNTNFRKNNLIVVPRGVQTLKMFTRFKPTTSNPYHPNIKVINIIRNGKNYEYVRIGFNGLFKFVKVISTLKHGVTNAMEMANVIAMQKHEEFLQLPKNEALVKRANQ